MRAVFLSSLSLDAKGVDVIPSSIVDPVPVGRVAEESRTRSEGPHADVDTPAP